VRLRPWGSRPGRPPNLFRTAVAGVGGQERVTAPSLRQQYPTDWSLDGRTIVYQVVHPDTGLDIWTVPATGDDRTPRPYLRTPASERQARLSPDGRWMAFASDRSGRDEVYVAPFPEPTEIRLVSTSGGHQPQWRRDGRELYYWAPGHVLEAVPFAGEDPRPQIGTPQELFRSEVAGGKVAPDGQRFVIARPTGESPPMTMVLNWWRDGRVRAAAPGRRAP
jgi:eukaryotic-like serine/threonine-protein kinase